MISDYIIKKEEDDNYFLIGELDFIENGFKFLPEADTFSQQWLIRQIIALQY